MYSYPSPTCLQIQFFLCKLDVRYREHILTQLVPILLKLVITDYMIYCVVFNCDFKTYLGISLKNSFYILPLSYLPHKITHIQTVLRHKRSQIWLFRCRFFLPMTQLTTDCDRVIVYGMPPSDGTDWNTLNEIRLFQMLTEIRISEDYCLSDILVADFSNITLRHIAKITPPLVKKLELCAFVSITYIYCVFKDNTP